MWRGMAESTWANERDVERAGGNANNNDEEASLMQADRGGGLRVAYVSRRHLAPGAVLLPCLLAVTLLVWRGSSNAAAGGDLQHADFQSLENKQLLEALEGATFAGAETVKAYGEWRTKHKHMISELDDLYNASLYKPREAKVDDKVRKAITAFPLGSLEDINGSVPCMHDEEEFAGVCYKKCSLLTADRKPIRTSAFACCEEEPCTWFNTKWSFGICSGFSVRGDSMGKGCGHVPGKCLATEELLGGQCYQKCSLLTNGSYPFRQTPNICCKARSKFACMDPMMYKAEKENAVGGRLGNKLIPEEFEEPHPPVHELTQVRGATAGKKTWVQQLLESSTKEQREKAVEAMESLGHTTNVKKKIMAQKEELKQKMMLPEPGAGVGGELEVIESSDGKLPEKDNTGTEEKSEEAAEELEEMMKGVAKEEKDELTALRSIVKEGSGTPSGKGAQPLPAGKEQKDVTGMPADASSLGEGNVSPVKEAAPSGGTAPTPGGVALPESSPTGSSGQDTKEQIQVGKGGLTLPAKAGVVGAENQTDLENKTSEVLPTLGNATASSLVRGNVTELNNESVAPPNMTAVPSSTTLSE